MFFSSCDSVVGDFLELCTVKAMVFAIVMYGCEKETWTRKLNAKELMLLMVLEKTLEESLGLQGDQTSPS